MSMFTIPIASRTLSAFYRHFSFALFPKCVKEFSLFAFCFALAIWLRQIRRARGCYSLCEYASALFGKQLSAGTTYLNAARCTKRHKTAQILEFLDKTLDGSCLWRME